MEIKTVSMQDYSSLHVGGSGKVVEVSNVEELRVALMHAKAVGLHVHVLGQGTNSYFGNDLRDFLFIHLNLKGIALKQELQTTVYKLEASASLIWDDVVALSVSEGLRGIENLSYIPGTTGAAPVQNIGAYGVELSDTFVSCEVMDIDDLSVRVFDKKECHFGYRDSIFKHNPGRYIILSITLLLSKESPFTLGYKPLDVLALREGLSVKDVRNSVIEIRKSKLPEWREHPNCGSFFKNPVVSTEEGEALRIVYPTVPLIKHESGFKVPAAWLIEHVSEMKGVKIGNLRTWDSQPLVIVNEGESTANDVDAFSGEIKKRIFKKTGILLDQEVNRVGRGAKSDEDVNYQVHDSIVCSQ